MNGKYDQRARTSIYETIRGRIENLYYEPGSELSIAELTQDLGVSRSPVRDALLRLERDKLIDIYPQRGTWVAKLDVENIMQERFLRLSVEENVFRKCIDAVLEDEEREIRFSSRLRANLVQQKACLSLNDIRTFLDLDVEFHRMFYIEIGFERIYKIVEAHTGNERRILSYCHQLIRLTGSHSCNGICSSHLGNSLCNGFVKIAFVKNTYKLSYNLRICF